MKKLNLRKETLIALQSAACDDVNGAGFTDRTSALAACAFSNRYYTACYPCNTGGGGGGTSGARCPQ